MKTCARLKDSDAYLPCAARAGDQEAQYQLGLKEYNSGNTKEAIKWLDRAAIVRYASAPIITKNEFNNSTIILSEKTGIVRLGHVGAQILLAEIYQKGLGVKPVPAKAERYLKMNENITMN